MEIKKGDYRKFLEWLTSDKQGQFFVVDSDVFFNIHEISIQQDREKFYTITVDGVSVLIYDYTYGELINSATLIIRTLDNASRKANT